MAPLSRAGRAAAAWLAAMAAGAFAARWPAAGAALGTLGGGWALARRRLPLGMAIAGFTAVAAAAALPWAALARDPFHALPASADWPVAAVALAFLGTGALVWTAFPALDVAAAPAVPAPPALRRALHLELGALALLLPVGIAGTQVALALIAATLAWAVFRGARLRGTGALGGPVAALLAAALVSIALAARPTPPWTITALRALVAFFVLGWALGAADLDEGRALRLVALWASASAAVSALAFVQHWSGFDLLAALHLRAAVRVAAPESPGHLAGIGTFASRLTFAHATLVPLAALLGLQLAGAARRPLWLGALALELAGLWSTFARAAWIAAAALAGVAAILALSTRERRRVLLGLGAAAAAVALLFALAPGARTWGLAALDPSANRDRLFLWARAAQIALDHPLHGVGFGSYHLILGPYYDRLDAAFPMRTWAHDMPLSLLCETGPFGLFAYAWLIVAGLSLAGSAKAPQPIARGLALGAALATLAFAIVATFHDSLYDGQVAYNLFFALALGSWATGNTALLRARGYEPEILRRPSPLPRETRIGSRDNPR